MKYDSSSNQEMISFEYICLCYIQESREMGIIVPKNANLSPSFLSYSC